MILLFFFFPLEVKYLLIAYSLLHLVHMVNSKKQNYLEEMVLEYELLVF